MNTTNKSNNFLDRIIVNTVWPIPTAELQNQITRKTEQILDKKEVIFEYKWEELNKESLKLKIWEFIEKEDFDELEKLIQELQKKDNCSFEELNKEKVSFIYNYFHWVLKETFEEIWINLIEKSIKNNNSKTYKNKVISIFNLCEKYYISIEYIIIEHLINNTRYCNLDNLKKIIEKNDFLIKNNKKVIDSLQEIITKNKHKNSFSDKSFIYILNFFNINIDNFISSKIENWEFSYLKNSLKVCNNIWFNNFNLNNKENALKKWFNKCIKELNFEKFNEWIEIVKSEKINISYQINEKDFKKSFEKLLHNDYLESKLDTDKIYAIKLATENNIDISNVFSWYLNTENNTENLLYKYKKGDFNFLVDSLSLKKEKLVQKFKNNSEIKMDFITKVIKTLVVNDKLNFKNFIFCIEIFKWEDFEKEFNIELLYLFLLIRKDGSCDDDQKKLWSNDYEEINEENWINIICLYASQNENILEVAFKWDEYRDFKIKINNLIENQKEFLYEKFVLLQQKLINKGKLSIKEKTLLNVLKHNWVWILWNIENLNNFLYYLNLKIDSFEESKKDKLLDNLKEIENNIWDSLDKDSKNKLIFFSNEIINANLDLYNNLTELILKTSTDKNKFKILLNEILPLYNNYLNVNKQDIWIYKLSVINYLKKNILNTINNFDRDGIFDKSKTELKEKVKNSFQSKFKLKWKKITFEQIEKLQNIWWDLNVLFTLVARFNSKSERKEEIPILWEVFNSLLNWSFNELKYEWIDEDSKELSKKQLVWLEWDKLKNYKTNPSKIKVINTNEEDNLTENDLFNLWFNYFKDQLIEQKHINLVFDWLSEELENIKISNEEEILFDKLKKDFKINELLKEINKLLKEFNSLNNKLTKKEKNKRLFWIILNKLKNSKSKETFEIYIDLLNKWIPWLDLSKISKDLKSIKQKLQPAEKWNEFISFSTIFDDPKLLLEIWDLVNTNSCQNYKTWTHIETLLWYVIDANIKWVMSFAITKSNFKTEKEYVDLKEIINTWNYEMEFNAPKKVLKIKYKIKSLKENTEESTEEEKFIEVQLNKAILRRVLKLWELESWEKWLFAENHYSSNHFWLKRISEEIQNFTKTFANNFWWILIENNEQISFPPSKNIWWVYSDAWWWIVWKDWKWYEVNKKTKN